MKKGVKIKQFDITDCGAACLCFLFVRLPYVPIMVCSFPLHVSANMRLPTRREQIFWG